MNDINTIVNLNNKHHERNRTSGILARGHYVVAEYTGLHLYDVHECETEAAAQAKAQAIAAKGVVYRAHVIPPSASAPSDGAAELLASQARGAAQAPAFSGVLRERAEVLAAQPYPRASANSGQPE